MDDHLEYSELPLPDMSELSLALSPPMGSSTMDVPVAFDPSLIPADSSQFASAGFASGQFASGQFASGQFASGQFASGQFASDQFASEDPPSARLGEYIQRFQASGEVQIPEAPRGPATDPQKPFACGWVDPRKGACDKAYGRECDLT